MDIEKNRNVTEVQNRVSSGGLDGKASAYRAGDLGLIPGSGRSSGEGNVNPLQYSPSPVLLPGKSHGQRNVVGYTPWGRRVGHDRAISLHFTSLHCIS